MLLLFYFFPSKLVSAINFYELKKGLLFRDAIKTGTKQMLGSLVFKKQKNDVARKVYVVC